MAALLKVDSLHTYIGEFHILQGVSFEAEKGLATVILGRNGVGKSTLFKSILNIIKPSKGHVIFNDEDITRVPTYKVVRKGIGFVPSSRSVFTGLTVMENLKIAYRGQKLEFEKRVESILTTFPELKRASNRSAMSLSGGEREMLAIACGVVNKVDLIMLDEPSEGLSPLMVRTVMDTLNKLKGDTTILLVEQNFNAAKLVGDVCYFMDKGQITFHTRMEEIGKESEILRKYLGVTF
ncbi:MAG: ABC transporter ATP-binding protein [Thaumarchaeota archaeon]|nr:ABC transporter ATP-binding protein [Nitrososphaerota archaeon]